MANRRNKRTRNTKVSRVPRNISGFGQTLVNNVVRFQRRYSNLAGNDTIISTNDILSSLGGICTINNTTLQCFYSSIKITRVRVASSCTQQGISTVCLTWLSSANFFRPGFEINAMSLSTAQPAMLTARPPQGCLAAQWVGLDAGNLFSVTGTGATTGGSFAGPMVMEIDLLATPAGFAAAPPMLTLSVTTAILGSFYSGGLAADAWVPQGVNYTT